MDGKLIDACALLFGSHTRRRGMAMLEELDTATVRRAYRVLAVANHPDALRRGGGKQGPVDGNMFIDISHAYELLMGYLLKRPAAPAPSRPGRHTHTGSASTRTTWEKRAGGDRAGGARTGAGERRSTADRHGPGDRRTAGERYGTGAKPGAGARTAGGTKPGTGSRTSAKPGTGPKSTQGTRTAAGDKRATGEKRGADFCSSRSTPLFYHGPVPHRRLRLAEYLYYTGRVSWQSLISAIVWQRQAQPRFGELAREMRGISGQDLSRILSSRLRHEQTGQTAQRLQLLTNAEVERILRLQRARRKLIGRYFVEKGGMTSPDLNTIIWEMHKHNARYGKQSKG